MTENQEKTIVFSKEETERIFEKMNADLELGQRKLDYESFLAQQKAEKMFIM